MYVYLMPDMVTDTKVTAIPYKGQTVSGYGGSIPTRHMLKVNNRWHRLKVMVYGNSGSPYITIGGVIHMVDDHMILSD